MAGKNDVGHAVAKLLRGNCLEIMPSLEPGSADLVITSPPYNAGNSMRMTFCNRVRALCRRVGLIHSSAPNGPRRALGSTSAIPRCYAAETFPLTYLYYPILKRHRLHLVQEIVWHYEGGMAYHQRFAHRTERWMWWVKDPRKYVSTWTTFAFRR